MLRMLLVGFISLLFVGCNLSDDSPSVNANNQSENNENNENNEELDCAGTPGGDAVEDECGVCDDDPSNDCVEDCAGEFGGDAVEDECGVCDADPSNDCEADCAGEFGGDAVEDMCGVCDDDPSNDCVQDCAGDFGGDAVEDMCGVCDDDPSNDCVADCNSDFGGDATTDACGRCVGGETGLVACPTASLAVIEDAHVSTASPDTNFGTEPSVTVDRNRQAALLKFDLSSLPNDIVIRSLTLRATASSNEDFGGSGDVSVYFASDDSWSETTVTENTRPVFSDFILASWNVANDPTDMETTYEIVDDAALIERFQGEVWGDRTVTLYVSSPGYRSSYFSRESADASKHFTVDVAYQVLSKVDVPVVADAYVSTSSPDTNFGAEETLRVDPRSSSSTDPPFTSFVRFDLSTIPANVTIERASLQMQAYSGFAYGGNGNCYTFLVDDDSWDEATITANNEPTWQTDDLGFWWLWYNRTPVDRVGTNASDKLIQPIRDAYDTDKLISFRFASSGYETNYRSREFADATQHPRITVYFTAN